MKMRVVDVERLQRMGAKVVEVRCDDCGNPVTFHPTRRLFERIGRLTFICKECSRAHGLRGPRFVDVPPSHAYCKAVTVPTVKGGKR